jgi:Double zinc ribbon
MICNICKTENTKERNFCLQCGNPLSVKWICDCSFENEIEAKFCGGCGKANDSHEKKNQRKSTVPQLNMSQINDLASGKILFNLGEEDVINQDDIDKIF